MLSTECSNKPTSHSSHSLTPCFPHTSSQSFIRYRFAKTHSPFKLIQIIYLPIYAFIHLCYSLIRTLNPSYL